MRGSRNPGIWWRPRFPLDSRRRSRRARRCVIASWRWVARPQTATATRSARQSMTRRSTRCAPRVLARASAFYAKTRSAGRRGAPFDARSVSTHRSYSGFDGAFRVHVTAHWRGESSQPRITKYRYQNYASVHARAGLPLARPVRERTRSSCSIV